ncbi:MAG: hypothetical protein A2104_05275 [Candidatus Melainabacteria bacterium GWF2_32_7]|nr:MAG: hypothetical protein A2104_05275 [Candidatus Melainabacteria bacterium GWF2_32_7]
MNYTYIGALHIHSNYSDGTASIKSIAEAAKKAGLSWIIITDHDKLIGLDNGEEGWYDGVAVLIGEEISTGDCNHYLALNINQEIKDEINPENFINEVKKQNGIGFVAHPDESLNRKNDYKPLRWQDWNIKGFHGLEIWNHLSDWVDNYDPKNPVYCYFNKDKILTGPTAKTIKWWDDLNNSNANIVPAIGGLDVHAIDHKFWGINFQIFPYYDSFKTLANYLYLDKKLSNDFDEAKEQIYNALKQGNNTIINRVWNRDKEEFCFCLKNKETCAVPGNAINLDNDAHLVIRVPGKARIRLIYNGQIIKELEGKEIIHKDVQKGKYRVEVYCKNRPWIFSNPILVI